MQGWPLVVAVVSQMPAAAAVDYLAVVAELRVIGDSFRVPVCRLKSCPERRRSEKSYYWTSNALLQSEKDVTSGREKLDFG